MNETSKSAMRRARDPAFQQHYFVGKGIDIGAGDDPLKAHAHVFPRVTEIVSWDKAQGDALRMAGAEDASFDFVHSSHCLEHLANPFQGLARWLELLKPGGYAILTVPDEDLYEKGRWPSPFNREHKVSFTICKPEKTLPGSVNVLDLVCALSSVASCERVSLVRENYDERRANVDQTARGLAECAIEIVLRKRAVPSARDMMSTAAKARDAQESLRTWRLAMKTYPYRFEVYHGAMLAWLRWNLIDEIGGLWAKCVECLPDQHLPRLYHALHTIASGKLQEGFRIREAWMRKFGWQRRTTAQPPSTMPAWHGEPLDGKSIVIWSEFGLGDEIFFLRFARILRERCGAARVSVMCQTPLVTLFDRSHEADAVYSVAQAADLPLHDYWVFPHAIPAHVALDLEALPQSVPYLHAPGKTGFAALTQSKSKLKVGVAFKGAPTHENDKQRSLPSLSVLDDLFKVDCVEFFSLQKGAGADEAADYARRLPNFHDVGASLNSMDETANAIAALDVVLTVDTSVAHVAAAMGKPTWLMLPFFGDWRWHYTRDDSPWYPAMRLFRKLPGGDWSEVVARVRGRLLTALNSDGGDL
ncbi:methyltransferase domain-containing protein [Paraburkholderia sp. MPAMCS5]|uniref:methyltransferase domain-containing protein n=1 Tax=Paraburkholderia sp. MPAMCS5 TaxID=3112563 RepID=UPI002E185B7C|nr:methyltransferase domain-containing protein [Paraburkholderia sp. MPAMCS5]